ncbi:MAG: tRNA-dihydrouridine synthase [Lachnospiraceae bacterium]|nr:tRNA-dihydrouridine synthase [Lachnospiraceae bacterium]
MQFYLAPMEEVTGRVFRSVYAQLFGDVDKYFTPFIDPGKKKLLKTRDRKEIDPEKNRGMELVPQLLGKDAQLLLHTMEAMRDLGYEEFNLNLGCPSGTVVSHGRGSGMLADPEVLKSFLEEMYEGITRDSLRGVRLSVKTRIGICDLSEWEEIREVYEAFPITELIIHPRLQREFYQGEPHREIVAKMLQQSKLPLCYNGDIYTAEDYREVMAMMPTLSRVMIGRGLVANPGLIREIRTGEKITKAELKAYHDCLFEAYQEELESPKDAIFKMKEFWGYMIRNFPGASLREIHKANRPAEYLAAVRALMANEKARWARE